MPEFSQSRPTPAAVVGRSRRLRRLAATLAVGVTALVASAVPAAAHAGLVHAEPGDGSTVTRAPTQVRLMFDEGLRTQANIVVTGPSGERVQHGPVRIHGETASIGVEVTASGRYTVAFRVVSEDGHPVAGETEFRFAPSGSADPGSAQPSTGEGTEHSEQAGHADASESSGGGGLGRGPVIGIAAGAALLAGLALLTVRRWPGGVGTAGGNAAGKDGP